MKQVFPFRARVLVEDGEVIHFDAFSDELPDRDMGQRTVAEWAAEHCDFTYEAHTIFIEAIRRLHPDKRDFTFADDTHYEIVCVGEMTSDPDNLLTGEPGDAHMTITELRYKQYPKDDDVRDQDPGK